MSDIVPGVILRQQFQEASKVSPSYFKDALDYTNEEAKTQQPPGFEEYQEYMDNEKKTTGLFDAFNDNIDLKQKSFYKRKFNEAYLNNGILWQPIISFDDDWLAEQGVISEHGRINEKQIKEATKAAMKTMLIKEGLVGRVYWTGAIHYNTDNIHVHISMVEKHVQRERGSIKQSTIDAAKSKVVSTIADRTPEQKRINELLRKEILDNARKENYRKLFKKQFLKIANNISKSQYGRLSNSEKLEVDKLSSMILKEKFPNSYQKLQESLMQEQNFYQRAYGVGDRHLYENYKRNKETELMTKLGNSILRQGKAYRDNEKRQLFEARKLAFQKKRANQIKQYHRRQAFFERNGRRFKKKLENKKKEAELLRLIRKAEREFQKNLSEYEKMIRESEYENEG